MKNILSLPQDDPRQVMMLPSLVLVYYDVDTSTITITACQLHLGKWGLMLQPTQNSSSEQNIKEDLSITPVVEAGSRNIQKLGYLQDTAV